MIFKDLIRSTLHFHDCKRERTYQVLGAELEDAAAARLLVLVAEQFDVRDVANLGPEEILEKRIVKWEAPEAD